MECGLWGDSALKELRATRYGSATGPGRIKVLTGPLMAAKPRAGTRSGNDV